MKPAKKTSVRRRARRTVLTLTQRVERLEKSVVFHTLAPAVAKTLRRFTRLDASGQPTTGDHVAVHDRKTGLTWTADAIAGGKYFNHADAMKACATLKLCGQQDWRAPTIEELLSIVDYARGEPAVDSDYFKAPYGWTWSSTPAKAPAGYAWGVYLGDGDSDRSGTDYHAHVRAVRAGQQLGLLG